MVDQRYLRPGFHFALAHAIEEAGEFLAAAGKTQRWGRESVNPDLPPDQQETNEAWMLREIADLRGSLDRLLSTLVSQAVEPEREDAEYCRRCGGNNPSWSAPSPLWNAVVRGGSIDGLPMFGDMLCIKCFVERAEGSGIASNWRLSATDVTVPLETITPSGRVWNDESWLWDATLPASPDLRRTIQDTIIHYLDLDYAARGYKGLLRDSGAAADAILAALGLASAPKASKS